MEQRQGLMETIPVSLPTGQKRRYQVAFHHPLPLHPYVSKRLLSLWLLAGLVTYWKADLTSAVSASVNLVLHCPLLFFFSPLFLFSSPPFFSPFSTL